MPAHSHGSRLPSPWLATCLAIFLAGCGGGGGSGDDDTPPAPPPAAGGGTTVAAAPLVISTASPTTLAGTLGTSTAQFESNSSNEGMTTYASTDPYCRVAGYALVNSGNGNRYYLEISFRKDTRAIGLVKFGDDASLAAIAQLAAPAGGVVVDIVNRRIGFTGAALSGTGVNFTLDGALDYPTNIAPENRAACG